MSLAPPKIVARKLNGKYCRWCALCVKEERILSLLKARVLPTGLTIKKEGNANSLLLKMIHFYYRDHKKYIDIQVIILLLLVLAKSWK